MNSLPVWPIILPLSAALLAVVWPRRSAWIGISASLATVFATLLLVWQVASQGPVIHALGGWEPGLGIALRADALATTLLLMSSLVTLAAGWYATGYFSTAAKQSQFWPIWLLMVTALHALFLSADLFNLYVTLELLGLSAVALAAMGGGRAAVAAALRYLTLACSDPWPFSPASHSYTHATARWICLPWPRFRAGTGILACTGLMSAGLLVKSALFPLHFWLPPAHANAPAPVSAVAFGTGRESRCVPDVAPVDGALSAGSRRRP